MKITVLDTNTGKTAESLGISTFEWKENSWSCDCNREVLFSVNDCSGICLGGKRFIVIKAEVENEDDYECSLWELNREYPEELLAKYGITKENINY